MGMFVGMSVGISVGHSLGISVGNFIGIFCGICLWEFLLEFLESLLGRCRGFVCWSFRGRFCGKLCGFVFWEFVREFVCEMLRCRLNLRGLDGCVMRWNLRVWMVVWILFQVDVSCTVLTSTSFSVGVFLVS